MWINKKSNSIIFFWIFRALHNILYSFMVITITRGQLGGSSSGCLFHISLLELGLLAIALWLSLERKFSLALEKSTFKKAGNSTVDPGDCLFKKCTNSRYRTMQDQIQGQTYVRFLQPLFTYLFFCTRSWVTVLWKWEYIFTVISEHFSPECFKNMVHKMQLYW